MKAFGSAGVWGLGLGESVEKMQYLPYAHTDFIFPIIGEELGLRMTLFVVFAFLMLTLSGILISLQARDRFGMLLGFGIVMNICAPGIGEYRHDHRAVTEQGHAPAVHQFRRVEPVLVPDVHTGY